MKGKAGRKKMENGVLLYAFLDCLFIHSFNWDFVYINLGVAAKSGGERV